MKGSRPDILENRCMRPQAGVLLLCLAHTSAFGLSPLRSIRTCFGALPLRSDIHTANKAGKITMSTPMNFAAVSKRDDSVFGSHRPGFLPDAVNEKPGGVDDALVAEWCTFIKGKGVTRILSLLEDDEALWYNTPIATQLEAHGFSEASGTYVRSPLSSAEGAKTAVEAITKAKESGDKIVLHCSGGIGRTGLISAVYLVKQYGLSPEDAVKEVTAQAEACGVSRITKPEKVAATLEKL